MRTSTVLGAATAAALAASSLEVAGVDLERIELRPRSGRVVSSFA